MLKLNTGGALAALHEAELLLEEIPWPLTNNSLIGWCLEDGGCRASDTATF